MYDHRRQELTIGGHGNLH